MNIKETATPRGYLTIREFDTASGEFLGEYADKNVITLEGYSEVMDRILSDGASVEDSIIHTIYLGDDVGSGDLLNPEAATADLTGTSQSVMYQVEDPDIQITKSSSRTFEATTFLDGNYILETYYPTEVDVRYCSATLRFRNGKTLSYKRFPARSISRLVTIQMAWVITFDEV